MALSHTLSGLLMRLIETTATCWKWPTVQAVKCNRSCVETEEQSGITGDPVMLISLWWVDNTCSWTQNQAGRHLSLSEGVRHFDLSWLTCVQQEGIPLCRGQWWRKYNYYTTLWKYTFTSKSPVFENTTKCVVLILIVVICKCNHRNVIILAVRLFISLQTHVLIMFTNTDFNSFTILRCI